MAGTDDYCDFCDLPRSQCIHGQPPPAPKPVAKASPQPRKRVAARTRTPGVAAKKVTRRWTPPEVFQPLIVEVLEDAGGALETDELFAALEARIAEQFLAGDQEKTPQGEVRWQYAARRARIALIEEGAMVKGRPGVWQLADA